MKVVQHILNVRRSNNSTPSSVDTKMCKNNQLSTMFSFTSSFSFFLEIFSNVRLLINKYQQLINRAESETKKYKSPQNLENCLKANIDCVYKKLISYTSSSSTTFTMYNKLECLSLCLLFSEFFAWHTLHWTISEIVVSFSWAKKNDEF